MRGRLRTLAWLALLVVVATAAFVTRIRHDMVDFEVYRTAGARAPAAEPLKRPEDGHVQFKYFPAFGLAVAPFSRVSRDIGEVVRYVGSSQRSC